ncbi:MAG: PAAR domain-containing protein [Halopseudomonas sabulinigri]
MSGKPAARLGDPTACPQKGHGTNPVVTGSADVLIDGVPAARMGDTTACGSSLVGGVIPNVLINGKPAAVLGSMGNHGNAVIAGSGTVLIGNSGGTPGSGLGGHFHQAVTGVAAAGAALISSKEITSQNELDYQIMLKRGGNRVLTPLSIPDFKELEQGQTENSETIDFLVKNLKQIAEQLTLEVFDDQSLIYSEQNTTSLLPQGEHLWQWDGYNQSGILDTQVLKSSKLFVRLTAKKNSKQYITELHLGNTAKEVDWVDTKIDRSSATVEVTVRPSFSDGGVAGKNSQLTAKTFSELTELAKIGFEHYWSRNGKRPDGIGASIQTSRGAFSVKVTADVNAEPSAKDFPLISCLKEDFGRSTSFAMFKKIYHNLGPWWSVNYPGYYADEDFKHTSAHEVGHLILNEYGDGGVIPNYSWSHKSTSTVLTQSPHENHPTPVSGEIDLMHYHSDRPKTLPDYWARSVASEQDVKGLLWLTRIKFDD